MIFLLEAILVSAIAWISWGALKRFILKSPLDNLPGPPSTSIVYGNISDLLSYDGWDYNRRILDTYGRAQKITGTLGSRIFLTYDPKVLHHILVKNQQFYEPVGFTGRNKVYLGEGLLSAVGEQHKKQRKMLNPLFSIKHMREMIPLFYNVTEKLHSALKYKLNEGPQVVDIYLWLTQTALELIGQGGMDYSFDCLVSDEYRHPCAKAFKQFLPLASGSFGFVLSHFYPYVNKWDFPRFKRFVVEHIPSKRVQNLKHVVDIMHNTSRQIIEKKKCALASNDKAVVAEMMEKKDIITTLMRANIESDEGNHLRDEEVYGQVSTLVFAAVDTTSSALARVFQILSMNMDAQDKLRNEIRNAQTNGQLTYDQLVSLPYLDAVCRETLRLFPPANFPAPRIANRDSIIPLSKPIIGKNGKEIRQIMIPRGTNIMISILGSNTDPDLWGSDALEWKPERWLSPLPKSLEEAHLPGIYSHLMTFLGGARACIGFKFSQLEMKVVMAVLLSSFKFEIAERHKVTWKMTGITGPYVETPGGAQPQLPVLISTNWPVLLLLKTSKSMGLINTTLKMVRMEGLVLDAAGRIKSEKK